MSRIGLLIGSLGVGIGSGVATYLLMPPVVIHAAPMRGSPPDVSPVLAAGGCVIVQQCESGCYAKVFMPDDRQYPARAATPDAAIAAALAAWEAER